MSPEYLGKLTSIGVNRSTYKPSVAEIKDEYFKDKSGAVDIITRPKNSPSKRAPARALIRSRRLRSRRAQIYA